MTHTHDTTEREQLQDLVNRLDAVLDKMNQDGHAIEEKSWDILRFTTAIVSISLSILALFGGEINRQVAVGGLILTIILLIGLFYVVFRIASQGNYGTVPGTPQNSALLPENERNGITPRNFGWRYDTSSTEYYTNLIQDYIGVQENHPTPSDLDDEAVADVAYTRGTIEDALITNIQRERRLNRLYLLSMGAMACAILTVTLAIGIAPSRPSPQATVVTATPTVTESATPTPSATVAITATPTP